MGKISYQTEKELYAEKLLVLHWSWSVWVRKWREGKEKKDIRENGILKEKQRKL